ncbi:hypothetical protein H0H81_007345 [Sphagnurus paluster]|uniref:Uncharacterized protein n=1 Tax=Sphagnurus paluster TaxID=117069 RepID=A0A9P7FT81_9AGAR|nr:hypothetical protein H0H81_007345 [Sphagnurus paluster]
MRRRVATARLVVATALLAALVFYLVASRRRAARLQRSLALQSSINRILGNTISAHTPSLQDSLSCLTRGTWKLAERQHSRLKRTKPASYTFSPSCPVFTSTADLCASLAGKHIVLIGPETTYYLHTLWLAALEAHENRFITCYGPEFCGFHHVCRSANSTAPFKKFPHQEDLIASNSSVIRYVLSTTLHADPNPKAKAYTQPTIDPATGVRAKNAYWIKHAKHAHVVIMNRGPLPAPPWTYEGAATGGDWAFTDKLYLDRATPHLDDDDDDNNNNVHSLSVRITNAALHATLTAFLPDTLRALAVLGKHASARHSLMWHGSWYRSSRCTAKMPFLVEDPLNPLSMIDPWSLYYNAQGRVANQIMEAIMPHYGGVFYAPGIPEEPSGVQREHVGDCLMYPATTAYGGAMQRSFLNAVARLVDATRKDD